MIKELKEIFTPQPFTKKDLLEVLLGAVTALFFIFIGWLIGASPAFGYFNPASTGGTLAYVDTTDYTFTMFCPIPSQVNNLSLYFTRSGIYDDKNVDMYINGNYYDTEYIPIGAGPTATGKENTFASSTFKFICNGSHNIRIMASSTVRLATFTRAAQASSTPPLFTTPYFENNPKTGYVYGMSEYVVLASSSVSDSSSGSDSINVVTSGGGFPMITQTNCTITSTSSTCVNTFDEFTIIAMIAGIFILLYSFFIWQIVMWRKRNRNNFDPT